MKLLTLILCIFLFSCSEPHKPSTIRTKGGDGDGTGNGGKPQPTFNYTGYVKHCVKEVFEKDKKLVFKLECSDLKRNEKYNGLYNSLKDWVGEFCDTEFIIRNAKIFKNKKVKAFHPILVMRKKGEIGYNKSETCELVSSEYFGEVVDI